ncbi:aminoacyl-tRNA hydrolase [Corynebacterium kroppenstedtii]|uniref:aminoacyl-tRNA hydrolase n=1 Tax=Corynebacterium sp. PCR 32 TaxID=3351342 RepID=UPI003095345F
MLSSSASRRGRASRPGSHSPSSADPFLVIGLGNPGSSYDNTRHNIGQMALDELASRALPTPLTLSRHKKTNTDVAQMSLPGPGGSCVPVILGRPRSYMNLSGGPTASLARYFHVLADNVIVLHDDLDLEFGTIRLKRGGGEGGHNGLRDITKALGTKNYLRVRVGVGRPPGRMSPADFVLTKFSVKEATDVQIMCADAADAVELLIAHGLEYAQNEVH